MSFVKIKNCTDFTSIRLINETIVYRGAPSPEFGKGHWKGLWVSTDRKSANQYDDHVWTYRLNEKINLLDRYDVISREIEQEFIERYPEEEEYVNQDDEFTELWMFPPDEFVDMLKEMGYDGYINGLDIFIINYDMISLQVNESLDFNDMVSFKTSQGSKYIRLSDGRMRRWKSEHKNTGGEDQGLHEWSQMSVFVDPKYDKEANSPQFLIGKGFKINLSKSQDGKMVVLVLDDNEWRPATWKDAYPVYTQKNPEYKDKVLGWEYTKTPTVGFNVVDFSFKDKQLDRYHFGSEVSQIRTITEEDKKLFFPSHSQANKNENITINESSNKTESWTIFRSDLQRFEVIHFMLQFYLYLKNKNLSQGYPSHQLKFDTHGSASFTDRLVNKEYIKQLIDEAPVDKTTGEYEKFDMPEKYGLWFSNLLKDKIKLTISDPRLNIFEHFFFLMNQTRAYDLNQPHKQKIIYLTTCIRYTKDDAYFFAIDEVKIKYEMIHEYKGREEELMKEVENMMKQSIYILIRKTIGIN